MRFGSLMNIDKLIHYVKDKEDAESFGSLMNIDKLIPKSTSLINSYVLVL